MNNYHISSAKGESFPLYLLVQSVPLKDILMTVWLGHHQHSSPHCDATSWFKAGSVTGWQVSHLKQFKVHLCCQSSVQTLVLLMLVISWWIVWTRHSVVHLHCCEENGSIQGFEHPGKMSDISVCGHDHCLHQPFSRLLRGESWLIYSYRRWVCMHLLYFHTKMYFKICCNNLLTLSWYFFIYTSF